MENIPVLEQTFQLLAGGIVLLALCLGIILYFWSLNLIKKIELLITKMRQNIDSLENLSQSIYETAYQEVKKEGRDLTQKQNDIAKKIAQNFDKTSEEQKMSSSNARLVEFSHPEEKEKYQRMSELIIGNLKNLLQEKEQVTVQELVYAMPNEYSLADIYRTLEKMKEKNQVHWEDRCISPQSILKMS